MDLQPGSAWFGFPALLAVAVVVAVITAVHSVAALAFAALGVLVLFLAIGLAMTIAKRA